MRFYIVEMFQASSKRRLEVLSRNDFPGVGVGTLRLCVEKG